jgi:hypothetical protein
MNAKLFLNTDDTVSREMIRTIRLAASHLEKRLRDPDKTEIEADEIILIQAFCRRLYKRSTRRFFNKHTHLDLTENTNEKTQTT